MKLAILALLGHITANQLELTTELTSQEEFCNADPLRCTYAICDSWKKTVKHPDLPYGCKPAYCKQHPK